MSVNVDIDELGRPVAATPVRIVVGTLTTDEIGNTVDVTPVRYVDDAVDVTTGSPVSSVPVQVVDGIITTNEVGQAVPVLPVRLVDDAVVANSAGQPMAALAVRMSGASPTGLLRAVSSLNRIPDATQALAAGHTAWAVEHPHYIGSGPVTSIAILLNFWAMSGSGSNAVLAIGNSGTVEEAWAYCNGVQVPILFAGDNPTLAWADLDADIVSLELTASQFGLSQFAPGTAIKIGMRGTVATAAARIPTWGVDQLRYDAGFKAVSFNPANTTPSASGGSWSYTGTTPTSMARAFAICLIGKFANGDPKTVLFPGDSVMGGTFDVNAGGTTPRGLGMRALHGSGGANRLAGITAAINGGKLDPWYVSTNSKKLFGIVKYCNIVVCEHIRNVVSLVAGGPNIFPTGETSVRNSYTSSWTNFRAAAAPDTPGARPLKIARLENSVRLGTGSTTGSSPNTAAAALGTQTPLNTPWGLGGDAKKLSDWIATQVGNGVGPDVLWDQSAIMRASTDPASADYYKVPEGINFDGVHFGYLFAPTVAADIRARIEALA